MKLNVYEAPNEQQQVVVHSTIQHSAKVHISLTNAQMQHFPFFPLHFPVVAICYFNIQHYIVSQNTLLWLLMLSLVLFRFCFFFFMSFQPNSQFFLTFSTFLLIENVLFLNCGQLKSNPKHNIELKQCIDLFNTVKWRRVTCEEV